MDCEKSYTYPSPIKEFCVMAALKMKHTVKTYVKPIWWKNAELIISMSLLQNYVTYKTIFSSSLMIALVSSMYSQWGVRLPQGSKTWLPGVKEKLLSLCIKQIYIQSINRILVLKFHGEINYKKICKRLLTGNTCKSMADSCQCTAKTTTIL